MREYNLELDSVRYRGPDSYYDGMEKIVVLLNNTHEFTAVEPLEEQLSDTEKLGPGSKRVEA